MEEDLQGIVSESLHQPYLKDIFYDLKTSIDKAADLRDRQLANNPELRRALVLVETFLRRTRRICYGGMAINAHLPAKYKFYDFTQQLPDYDFYSPTAEKDAKYLAYILERAKFESVSVRLGMHEGTYKVFVNYHSVADITDMPEWLYKRLLGRALVVDGIHYCDEDFLRMNMYLELSRPKGEVERWDKVYQRLILLNMAKPITYAGCSKGIKGPTVSAELHEALLDYAIEHDLIFYGPELEEIYKHPRKSAQYGFLKKSRHAPIFVCPNPGFHIPILRQLCYEIIGNQSLRIVHWKQVGENLPETYGLEYKGELICLLVGELFCTAYNVVKIPPKRELKVGALDSAIVLYYTFAMMKGLEESVPHGVYCFAKKLIAVSMATRDKGKPGPFPSFVLECQGHQPTKESLLKAKAERIAAAKTRRKRSGKGKTEKKH